MEYCLMFRPQGTKRHTEKVLRKHKGEDNNADLIITEKSDFQDWFLHKEEKLIPVLNMAHYIYQVDQTAKWNYWPTSKIYSVITYWESQIGLRHCMI